MIGLGATAVLAACNSDPGDPAASDAVTIDGAVITVRLDRIDALRTIGTAYVIGAANVIVLRVGEREYRAFSNVCTHSGCGIFIFERERMKCQCHGSEFNLDGVNVAGPAPLPLAAYATRLDVTSTILTVSKPL